MRRLDAISILCLLLIPSAWAGEKPWIEVSSPHFRVLTDGSANEARHVAHEFEQMRSVFAEHNPQFRLEGGAPLTIFAAQDEATAKTLEPNLWKLNGAKVAGVYHHAWEREYVMVRLDAWTHGNHEVVYHEYAHAILHRNLHWIPVWLDEGMAHFYGFTRFKEDKIYVGAPLDQYRMMNGKPLIPLETLLKVDQRSPYYHDEDKVFRFYSESWGLVHFLMFGPGMERGKKLNQYSTLLQQGVDSKKAFEQAVGDLKSIESQLQTYMSQLAFQVGVMPNPPKFDEKAFSGRTLSMAETKAELAGFHLWTHDSVNAGQLAREATKQDPKLGYAHEVMGFVDFGAGQDEDALNEFTQASTLNPNLPLSLFARTMMLPISTSSDPAAESLFHDVLTKVLQLNPQFAPAYVELAKLALRRGDPQTAFGVARKAEELEPTRAGYHILSGEILHRLGKDKDAATFARFVTERWPGADHDEAMELWNAIPAEQRPPGVSASEPESNEKLMMDGHLTAVRCAEKEQSQLILDSGGKSYSFRMKGPFSSGFSDTIWYGEDHFSLCHHLQGTRAVIRYKAASDSGYAGDVSGIEIRDELPPPQTKSGDDNKQASK